MDRMLYLAMEGAKQTLRSQSINSNNLANVSTTGFRADLDAVKSLQVYGPGYEGRVYPSTESNGSDLSAGTLVSTGRELDFAVKDGDGWIGVQAPDGVSEAYTRAGDLRFTESGMLTNGAGHPILGNGGPIVLPPFEKLEIGADGAITILPVGQDATTMVVADRIRLVSADPGQLEKRNDGLMYTRDGINIEPDTSVRVTSGALESSNVNTVEAMVKMIELGRKFEMQVKMMKTAQDNDAASARLLQS
ncbi:flagellar biosynthesis protein FlgF [Solemya pervernicosa gill symbiont]|uniref:Flagellar basal-body rod protein FlgF n=1 Tax=Solemya pervernicosa gill symbiont TaxID=642797 RepID=A0A1T2L8V6_9GAMM|nr:flagellar basal body rod protein FlgF [Solemya pervernicosa gill symbiont]OOZ41500.1 flagellar biosynthesis protein FlgF [Solemya pervernicosa gill symbiont]